jgi:hypothetical protein
MFDDLSWWIPELMASNSVKLAKSYRTECEKERKSCSMRREELPAVPVSDTKTLNPGAKGCGLS